MPIIGRDFSDIANQQFQYAGFNRAVEEGNLARAARAEDIRNNWLARIAEMQRQDAARQAQAQAGAQELGFARMESARKAGEQAREFDVSADIQRESQKERNKWLKVKLDETERQKKEGLDAVENFGKFLAPDADRTGKAMDEALAQYQRELQNIETARAQIEKDLPPGKAVYDRLSKGFVPGSAFKNDAEAAKLASDANQRLSQAKADFDSAKLEYQTHLNAFDTLRKQAAQNNLQISKRGKKYVVYSPLHNRTFGGEDYGMQEPAFTEEADQGPAPRPFWMGAAPAPQITGMGTEDPASWAGFMRFGQGGSAPTGSPVGGITKQWVRGPDGRLVLAQ